jgi:hypothetical protein
MFSSSINKTSNETVWIPMSIVQAVCFGSCLPFKKAVLNSFQQLSFPPSVPSPGHYIMSSQKSPPHGRLRLLWVTHRMWIKCIYCRTCLATGPAFFVTANKCASFSTLSTIIELPRIGNCSHEPIASTGLHFIKGNEEKLCVDVIPAQSCRHHEANHRAGDTGQTITLSEAS